MNRVRSIRVKLITFYVSLLTLVFIGFGAYVYLVFQHLLTASLEQALLRRANQIAATIVDQLPEKGEAYVASEIQARYAPELNERAIRIVDNAGHEIYESNNARFLAESRKPTATNSSREYVAWMEAPRDWEKYQVVAIPHQIADGRTYFIEVAAPLTGVTNALDSLVLTFLIGCPVLIGLSILGGYSLLGRALRPMDEIVGAAERITFKNANQRLPVPQTEDEFQRISEALNRMIERLDESFQSANRFAGDASHELRTPLTILQGELEIFVNDASLPADALERAGDMLDAVIRLAHIVDGLLFVSRLEAGEGQLNRSVVNLGEMASAVAEQMDPLCREKLITVKCETEPGVYVEGDEVRLSQVLVNLLDNAIKYTPEGGKILVESGASTNRAFLQVRDTGIGISPEALPQVFERFFRSEEARSTRAQGSGLGLAIAKSIVEAHGGSISANSKRSQGATFRVELPLFRKEHSTQPSARHLLFA